NMSSGLVTSPTSIHPALSSPFPSLVSPNPNAKSDGADAMSTLRLKSSNALKDAPNSQHSVLSIDTAKSSLRNIDPSEPSSAAATLESVPQLPDSFSTRTNPFGHRKNGLSIESIPRQTLLKALAGSGRKEKPEALSLGGVLSKPSIANTVAM